MAAKKQSSKKKGTKKATSKAKGRPKTPKVSKARAKPATPQDAAKKPQGDSLNPYRAGGAYWASVEGLKALGMGQMHPFDQIVPAVRKQMGDNWKAFAEKEARSEETGKDADHRILQNVSVITRKDYGKPLRDLGYEVRWDGRAKVAGLFKIDSE